MPVKDVWLHPPPGQAPKMWSLSSGLVCLFVTTCSKIWIGLFNKVIVNDRKKLHDFLGKERQGRPVITVSNHLSCLDDPLLAHMLGWRHCLNIGSLRWLLGARDICFRTYRHSLFFSLGKVLPIERGGGVYQQAMDFCVKELSKGKWVHIYPEGKVNMDKKFMRLKWGVGRLIADSQTVPLVLPYWHIGMDHILPNFPPYIPQMGKNVTVTIGEPMDFTEDLTKLRKLKKSDEEIRKHVTDVIQLEFKRLKDLTEARHYRRFMDDQNTSADRQSSSC